MGYLIKESGGDLVKIEAFIRAGDMQQLATLNSGDGYQLNTIKAGFVFCPVTVILQVNGTIPYSTFNNIWLFQGSTTPKNATFGRTGSNFLAPTSAANFIVNIDHGTTPTNKFGSRTLNNRDFFLKMDIDDASGDGDGFLTIYGYYLPEFI